MKSSSAAHVVAERRSWGLGEAARRLARRWNSGLFLSSRSSLWAASGAVGSAGLGEGGFRVALSAGECGSESFSWELKQRRPVPPPALDAMFASGIWRPILRLFLLAEALSRWQRVAPSRAAPSGLGDGRRGLGGKKNRGISRGCSLAVLSSCSLSAPHFRAKSPAELLIPRGRDGGDSLGGLGSGWGLWIRRGEGGGRKYREFLLKSWAPDPAFRLSSEAGFPVSGKRSVFRGVRLVYEPLWKDAFYFTYFCFNLFVSFL